MSAKRQPKEESQAAGPLRRLGDAVERPSKIPVVDSVGEYSTFLGRGARGFGRLGDYSAEVLRQTALLATGSVLIILTMGFVTGASCGVAGGAISRAVGAGIAGPIFSAFCTTREVVPFVFGFIVAAKIGGGFVAQLGTARVTEEVDALEVMGIPSMTFLVSTRMMAALLILPVCFLLTMAAGHAGAWFTSLIRDPQVSQGTWEFAFYTAIDPVDLIYTAIKGLVLSFTVIAIALFFGYRVSGGPVEVGEATARSMAVNLMAVTILNMVMTFVFWGFNPNLPVA
jgi:phospholipid/cholesterol/gamma-HCH transport system permease protein